MQEYTSPGEVKIAPDGNLLEPLWENARRHPNRAALSHRVGDRFVDVTARQFADTVTDVARGLIALGIEPGSRICLFSSTRIEWTYLDHAIWAAGCTTVPIYETSSAEQVQWIAGNSGAVAIFCENDDLRAVYDEVADQLEGVKHVYVIEDGALDQLAAEGTDVDPQQVRDRSEALTGDDLATIVYTSGTTGRPKGCMITHANLYWDSTQVQTVLQRYMNAEESTLLFLPLAHIFARIIQEGCIFGGVKLGFSTGIDQLTEELGLFHPTFLLSVPRVFEKVYNRAQQKAHNEGKGAIFDRAAQVAIDHSKAEQAGDVPLLLRAQHALFDRLVYRKLRDALGGEVTGCISGGASLGERLGHFFNGIGVPIYEGYGLTETTAGACVNRPGEFKIGTVGKPVPGASVRIADDGEILIKGGHVFRGYYQNEEATEEALDDGWFHTGDIGELDAQGFLRITGRKKELIVTAAGKNVAPAVLEDRLRSHRLISQAMVVGDGEKFIGALVALDAEEFATWAQEHGHADADIADLVDDRELRTEIEAAVEHANKAVSRAESIREFRIVPEDFSIEGGELTPTLKVKRSVVADKYGDLIGDIYGRA